MDDEQKQQEIERLTKQIRESCHAEALAAVEVLREKGWLTDGSLIGVRLGETDTAGNDSITAKLNRADLRGAVLRKAEMFGAALFEANLSGADLKGADLNEAEMCMADLRGADLREAHLGFADLGAADLRGAKLSGIGLGPTDLRSANLSGVDLSEVDLRKVNLGHADLSRANLNRAILIKATLYGTKLAAADLSEVVFGHNVIVNVDLSMVKGLDTIRHFAPSYIDFSTIRKSKGRIPEVFLRGCGLPEHEIQFAIDLDKHAFQCHPIYISFAREDEEFARRIHSDLQAEGLRCWLDPEAIKFFGRNPQFYFSAINRGDKLVLILSEHSVNSKWIEDDVDIAISDQYRSGEHELFPVRVDAAVMQSEHYWAEDLQELDIYDFTDWKQHDAYKKAFDRLLHDLKASSMT